MSRIVESLYRKYNLVEDILTENSMQDKMMKKLMADALKEVEYRIGLKLRVKSVGFTDDGNIVVQTETAHTAADTKDHTEAAEKIAKMYENKLNKEFGLDCYYSGIVNHFETTLYNKFLKQNAPFQHYTFEFIIENDVNESLNEAYEDEDMFEDPQGILGVPGDEYTFSEIEMIYDWGKRDDDPSMQGYTSFEDWWKDTRGYLNRIIPID